MLTVTSAQSADRVKDHPFRSLVVIAILSTVVITLLTGIGSYRSQMQRLIANAENRAFQVAESLMQREQGTLFQSDLESRVQVSIPETELARLDSRVRDFLRPFGIVRISIYNADRSAVYSSDQAMAGRPGEGNASVATALSGTTSSSLVRSARLKNLAGEKMADVAVVSTAVPVRDARGRVIGVFELMTDVSGASRELLGTAGKSGAIVLSLFALVWGCALGVTHRLAGRLGEVEDELQRMAITDPLTGIANRRQIIHRIAEEFARYVRKRKDGAKSAPLCLVMADVDLFRMINDTYGHAVSDGVLREIAARIVHALRPYDLVGRFGDEEFLVLLPETELEEGWRVAGRIRAGVADEAVRIEDHLIQVTASFGIACVQSGEKDYTAALKRAASGMSRAKEAGRNQVVCGEDQLIEAAAAGQA